LIATYEKQHCFARENHSLLIHVDELTQPQAIQVQVHKDADRLAWEKDYDCIRQMKLWMIAIDITSSEDY
jgi:hypothetical protein